MRFWFLLETVFYLQVGAFFILLLYGVFTRSASVFLLAGVFSILIGAMLAGGEDIDFFTGGFTVSENDDGNQWSAVPDYESETISTSSPVNMWHFVFLYGGFVWLIVAAILAVRGRTAGDVIVEG